MILLLESQTATGIVFHCLLNTVVYIVHCALIILKSIFRNAWVPISHSGRIEMNVFAQLIMNLSLKHVLKTHGSCYCVARWNSRVYFFWKCWPLILMIYQNIACCSVFLLFHIWFTKGGYYCHSHLWIINCESCSVVSNSLQPYGLYSPWNSLGPGVGSLFPSSGDLPTQGSNPGLPHCRQIL